MRNNVTNSNHQSSDVKYVIIKSLLRLSFIVFAFIATLGFIGCDGGGDDDTMPVNPPPAAPTPQLAQPLTLANGTISIPPGGPTLAASFSVGQSGTLSAIVTFGGPTVVGLSGF